MRDVFIISMIVLVGAMTTSVLADFSYTDFSSTNGLTLVGNSSQYQNGLRLAPAASWQVGAVWNSSKQFVQTGFETDFTFQISNSTELLHGDGFAFVIQNDSLSAIGQAGFNLGYGGINNNIAIEFDTYQNSRLYHNSDDPSHNHVSVQVIGAYPYQTDIANSIGYTSDITNMIEGVHSVNIKYTDGVLAITFDNQNQPNLSIPMVIGSFMNSDAGKAWVGFTASTGSGCQNHDILNWSFVETPEPATLLLLGLGGLFFRRKKH